VSDRVAIFVATVGGAGLAPVAPGTVGSVVAALLLWLIPFSPPGLIVFLVAVTAAGIWAAPRAERLLGARDPGAIVIDEVAGLTLALRAAERLPGGMGVVVDDLVAGLYTLGVLLALSAVAGWP